MRKRFLLASLLVVLALFFAVGTAQAAAPAQDAEEPVLEIPFLDEWMNSPHNDTEAEAFTHWNEENPAEIPESCAKCHNWHKRFP